MTNKIYLKYESTLCARRTSLGTYRVRSCLLITSITEILCLNGLIPRNASKPTDLESLVSHQPFISATPSQASKKLVSEYGGII